MYLAYFDTRTFKLCESFDDAIRYLRDTRRTTTNGNSPGEIFRRINLEDPAVKCHALEMDNECTDKASLN